ncbi:hypothetical protein GNI_098510 [Gregarina niphandrodes]|nr:hypothetical protein GNI_098510 [Gregarina niphandrodes]EZG57261.1 hypothetical protein GNI_098510 [Gregarina niphandrodes]|eukprot:XP_011131068.1 hypothetical protein GNI_098510 [Gregarina niphandrodes]
MLGAMQDLVKQLHVLEKMLGSRYKGHTASLAAQTALAAFLETEVHTTAETVEQAILLNQTELAENVEFLSSYANLQKLVADLDNSGEHPY